MKGRYCPLTTPNEHKRHWLTGPTQLCLREVESVDGKWICEKHGDINSPNAVMASVLPSDGEVYVRITPRRT